jgi:hypothetical protein
MRRARPFVELSERELRAEAERLVRSGKMPTLSELSQAVVDGTCIPSKFVAHAVKGSAKSQSIREECNG